jgi:hypothetical protein
MRSKKIYEKIIKVKKNKKTRRGKKMSTEQSKCNRPPLLDSVSLENPRFRIKLNMEFS